MEAKATLGLLDHNNSNSSGESNSGSMEDNKNLVLSSEVSSSYADESDLELGLGLGLSCGGGGGLNTKSSKPAPWGQYARILTVKYFQSHVYKSKSSASSTINTNSGTKRTAADSVSPPKSNGTGSQVVGWPPIKTYTMNNLVSQEKSPTTEEFSTAAEENKNKNYVVDHGNNNIAIERRPLKSSLFIKVNMDGTLIGRKVDLNAHSCYETLVQTLDDMFCRKRSSLDGNDIVTETAGVSKLLAGSSEFVLTYEDKEGDWMLVGVVP